MDDLGDASNIRRVPSFVGEGHYESYNFIMKLIKDKRIPQRGNTVIRLDSHLDQIVPKDRVFKAVLETGYTEKLGLFHDFGVEDLQKKLYEAGAINRIFWVKPPWAKQVLDDKDIICQKLPGKDELTLDIITLGKTLFGSGDELDDYENFKSTISKSLTAKDSYILDIDYNFFSSYSPFAMYFEKIDYNTHLEDIFALKLPENQEDEQLVKEAADFRVAQLKELKEIFKYLEEHREMPKVDTPSEHYLKVEKLKELLLEHYKDDEIEWKIFWDRGVISGPYYIPFHVNTRDDIVKMIQECLSKILDCLPGPPSCITMARTGEYDCYVPNKDCNFIERNIYSLFKEKYNLDEPEMPYLDM